MVLVHSFKDPMIWFTVQVIIFVFCYLQVNFDLYVNGVNVLVVYAPLPFENASISTPEVGIKLSN